MADPSEAPSPVDRSALRDLLQRVGTYLREVVRRTREEADRDKQKNREAELTRADALRRPPGWVGHWSTRYGNVLARALHRDPPFDQPQRKLLAAIPKPLHEALDPAASAGELIDRDGNLAAWRFSRSVVLDLFGPLGLVVGALALAALSLTAASPRLGLPPLKEQLQMPEPGKEQQGQQDRQQGPPRPPGPARR
jgi:hypothetical protein